MPLSREDLWLTRCLLLALALAAASAAVNAAAFRFTGICYFPRLAAPLLCLALHFAYFDRCYLYIPPRAGFLARNCAFYGLAHVALALFVTGLQVTPFPPIDPALRRWDNALGFDTAAALAWTASHPALRSVLNACYASTDAQLALAPLVAGLAFDRRRTARLLAPRLRLQLSRRRPALLFFPSSGPAGVYASPHFLDVQRLTSLKFQWVHRRQAVPSMLGGMIAFPSFHVAWAALTTYAALPSRPLFRAIAALNALVVASTVLLGWHYLVDVPAGLALARAGLAGRRAHRPAAEGRLRNGESAGQSSPGSRSRRRRGRGTRSRRRSSPRSADSSGARHGGVGDPLALG